MSILCHLSSNRPTWWCPGPRPISAVTSRCRRGDPDAGAPALRAHPPRTSRPARERSRPASARRRCLCLKGACALAVNGTTYDLGLYDAIYVPRGSAVEVTTATEVDLVECAADVDGRLPAAGRPLRRRQAEPGAESSRAGGAATSRDLEHRHRRQRARGAHPGRLHALGARQLDQLAAARAHRAAGRGLRLLRHAGRRRSAFSSCTRSPSEPEFVEPRARRRRGADAGRLPPQRGGARAQHQLHLDDGRAPRGAKIASSAS